VNPTLLIAGGSSILVATAGMSVGRSPPLSGAFAVVGLALLVLSSLAPRPIALAEVATAPLHVVRAPRRARQKLLSVITLVLLLLFSILVLAVVFVTLCVTTFVILSGH
jgi:hypothetical protein